MDIIIEYIGPTYEIMEGVLFETGTLSCLPKDIWDNETSQEMKDNWKAIENYGS